MSFLAAFAFVACGGEEAAPAAPAEAPAPPPAAEPAAPPPAEAAAPAAAAGVPAAHWPAPPAPPFYSCHREAQGWCGEYTSKWLGPEPGPTGEKNICEGNGGVWATDVACKRDALLVVCSDPAKASYYAFTEAGAAAARQNCVTGTVVEKPA